MSLTNKDFTAKEGSYYAHIFENKLVGLPRALYWSFTVHFEDIPYSDETWDSSLTIEWIGLGVRDFKGSNSLDPKSYPDAESSLYFAEHHPIERWKAKVSWLTASPECIFEYDVALNLSEIDEGPASKLHLKGRVPLRFEGFIIVPENLSPKPKSLDQASALLGKYFDRPLHGANEDGRYVFRP